MTSKPRLSLSKLGNVGQLPLSARDIAILAAKWGGPGSVRARAWADIKALATIFMACSSTDTYAATRSWHHLVMAVGNFKRSAGTILPPPIRDAPMTADTSNRQRCSVPLAQGATWALGRDDPITWQRLTETIGLGPPTATTLLAALWTDNHVIMDRRAAQAAIGLAASTTWNVTGVGHYNLPARDWQFYADWYRPTLLHTAQTLSCPPVMVERAMFCLDGQLAKLLKHRRWTWSDYRPAAEEWIAGNCA
jgi:hypothetical protein